MFHCFNKSITRFKRIILPLKLKFACFVSPLSVSVVLPMSWDVCSLNEGITGVNWLHLSIQLWRGLLHLCIAFCLAHNDGRCFLNNRKKLQFRQAFTLLMLNCTRPLVLIIFYLTFCCLWEKLSWQICGWNI